MGVYEVTFSELQLQGKATVERLRKSPAQSLLVRRRDAEDLVLTTAARAELEHTAASVTTRMFVALMQRDGGVRELVTDVLPEVFPYAEPAEKIVVAQNSSSPLMPAMAASPALTVSAYAAACGSSWSA